MAGSAPIFPTASLPRTMWRIFSGYLSGTGFLGFQMLCKTNGAEACRSGHPPVWHVQAGHACLFYESDMASVLLSCPGHPRVVAKRPIPVKLGPVILDQVKSLAELRHRFQHWLMHEAIHQFIEQKKRREEFRNDMRLAWPVDQESGSDADANIRLGQIRQDILFGACRALETLDEFRENRRQSPSRSSAGLPMARCPRIRQGRPCRRVPGPCPNP
ncbi:MAG: hypothetical protein QM682_16205 [Paracoccus sp. (in: a-proteobacteria)]|uniref:CopG family ribbon-helix-helix protein n=1 Tax=Paracoccus sp. TaxID=267 RepID=UPI0039E5DA86